MRGQKISGGSPYKQLEVFVVLGNKLSGFSEQLDTAEGTASNGFVGDRCEEAPDHV